MPGAERRCPTCGTVPIRRPHWTMRDMSHKLMPSPWYWTCGCGWIGLPSAEELETLEPHMADTAYYAVWILENLSPGSLFSASGS